MPGLYVETGLPPATRHAICHFLIDPSPGREFPRARAISPTFARRGRPVPPLP
jgi:hypothetical protein